MRRNVKVIGCGVSGLTVALLLLKEGFTVEIITEKLHMDTTSSKAAAIWFPHAVKPKEKVNNWSKITYNKFKELCVIPESGVSMVTLTVLVKNEEDAWWKDALPKNSIKKINPDKLHSKFQKGYTMCVPLVETQLYLNYLLKKIKELGGKITLKKIKSIEELTLKNEVVVNCTGLGSRELVNDQYLYPILGQVIKAAPQKGVNPIIADFVFDESEEELAYIIPRRDCLILGGTSIKNEENTVADNQITKGIIRRCKEISPDLGNLEIKSVAVGLRPGRREIRLEKEGNLIHNYGHGGGGFTVSWGCAKEVLKIINQTKISF